MKIVRRKVDELTPDPRNANLHGERNLLALEASLRRFKQQKPIVITPDNVIVAGEGLWTAMKKVGRKTIDCVVTELEGSDLTAYALADNRTAELSQFDHSILANQLAGLEPDDWASMGWEPDEVAQILADQETGLAVVPLVRAKRIVIEGVAPADKDELVDTLRDKLAKFTVNVDAY